MKKAEFEALLLDCEKLKQLCEEHKKCMPCTGQRISPKGATRLQKVTPAAGAPRKSTCHPKFIRKSYSLNDLHRTGAGTDTAEGLRHAVDHYRKNPSLKSATLLEMAINRLTLTGDADEKTRKLVKEAMAVLSEKIEGKGDSSFRGDNIAATFWVDSNFHGSALVGNLPLPGTYTGWPSLGSYNFNDKISSLKLQASPDEIGGRVFLFQNDRFLGRYVQYDTGSGTENDVGYVGGYINDRTSSVLIYRQFAGEIVQTLGALVPSSTITDLIDSQDGLASRGDPVFTWDLYPAGGDGHPNDSSSIFIYIRIPITIEIPHWFDYDAEIRFWVTPFTDQGGLLQVPLEYYGAWVEGGVLSSALLDGLMSPEGIPSILGQVTGLISGVVDVANLGAPYQGVYLLPGRNEGSGNTDDDVTIVLMPGTPLPPGPIL